MATPTTGSRTSDRWGTQRETLRNRDVVAYIASHLLAAIAEWAVYIGVLVYTEEHAGATAAGLASIAIIVPYVITAPLAGMLAERYAPARVRIASLAVQAVAYAAAAIAAWAAAPPAAVVVAAMVALAALTTLRPAGAALLPAIVRSSRELTVANLWQGHCESVSVLGGPLLATGLLFVGGAPAVITGCAVAAAIAFLVASLGQPVAAPGGSPHTDRHDTDRLGAFATLREQVKAIHGRGSTGGVLVVEGAQYVLIGGLDLLLVVVAAEELDLGDSGAGVLSTAFGVGALASVLLVTRLSRRSRLAPILTAGMVVVALGSIVLGSFLNVALALLVLPVLGMTRSTVEVVSRLLLQRSAPPTDLGALFAALEMTSGVGLMVGSLLVQVLIAGWGADAALIGLGVTFAALTVATRRSLRYADDSADIPVVAMSMLRRLPVFAPLPPLELEAVARSAEEITTTPAERVVTQGEPGDVYYAVADGQYDVTIDGRYIRTIPRGGSFGEIALLADVPRTATVTSREQGSLLAVQRAAFLLAVTGHDSSRRAAWGAVQTMEFAVAVPDDLDEPHI
jgi:MFS family permease